MVADELRRGRVGHDRAVVPEHHHPVDQVEPGLEVVLDHHERRAAGTDGVGDGGAHGCGVDRVEHRRRLVEQHQVGLERQDPGESQALQLPARQRRREVVPALPQSDRLERAVDPTPRLVPVEPHVLRPERDVTAHAVGDHRVARLLRDEPHPPVDRHGSAEVTGQRRAECSDERVEQRRLAGAARAREQHPRPGLDVEVEAGDDRGAASQGPPREPVDPDLTPHRGLRPQTSCCASRSRPGPKASSTPARARACVRSHPPAPATTAPESAKKPR